MLGSNARPAVARFWAPVVARLARAGVTPDMVTITGTVTRLDFVNPHSWLHLDVTQPDGKVVAVRCEMRSATTLRRSGWSPELFPVGKKITITGSPDRADPYSCYVSTVAFADGSRLDRYGQIAAPLDIGRAEHMPVQAQEFYRFSFRVPTQRNVELTAPYMHNGRLAALRDVKDPRRLLALGLASPEYAVH